MQAYRTIRTKLPSLTRTISNPSTQPIRTCAMSSLNVVQPRSQRSAAAVNSPFYRTGFPFGDVESLFSLFDVDSPVHERLGPNLPRTFQPRFDVRETADAFHLAGELPGMSQKDVTIEFVDNTTLTVHGRVVREYEEGDASLLDNGHDGAEKNKAVTEAGEEAAAAAPAEGHEGTHGYHKPTVQEEEAEASGNKQQDVAKAHPAKKENKVKYWVSERSIGAFHRSFNFPGQVDHNGVKARMSNGILHVDIPKAKRHETRKITID